VKLLRTALLQSTATVTYWRMEQANARVWVWQRGGEVDGEVGAYRG